MNTNWVLLLLLIFAGQTISVPMVNHHDCESDHSSSVTSSGTTSINKDHMHHDMSSMTGHDMSDMPMMDMNADSPMDCCGDECQCTNGVCLTSVYITKIENKLSLFSKSTVHFYPSQFSNIQRSSSFYRPPIIS